MAIDSAQIVLVNSDLEDVAASVRLGRGTLRNIHQNLFWAFFYNLICIPLAAGLFKWEMNPMIAAAAMSLSSVTVCLNALRLNLLDIRSGKRDRPRRKKHAPQEPAPADEDKKSPDEVVIRVEGMMCPHCEATVQKALEALGFIRAASADHEKGTVTLETAGEIDPEAVQRAVETEGYTFGGVVK